MARPWDDPVVRTLAEAVADGAVGHLRPILPAPAIAELRELLLDALYLLPGPRRLLLRVARDEQAAPAFEVHREAARRPERAPPPRPEDPRRALILSVQPLVRAFAARYASAGARDDLEQEGMIVVTELADRYDAAKGRFSTFVFRALQHRMVSLSRKAGVLRRRTARPIEGELEDVEDPVSDRAALEAFAERFVVSELLGVRDDGLATPEGRTMRAERRRALEAALGSLTHAERELVRLLYDEELPTKAVAERLGWSQRTTQRRHGEVLERLAEKLRDAVVGA